MPRVLAFDLDAVATIPDRNRDADTSFTHAVWNLRAIRRGDPELYRRILALLTISATPHKPAG